MVAIKMHVHKGRYLRVVLLTLVAIFGLVSLAQAADVVVQVDRTRVLEGDTLQMSVTFKYTDEDNIQDTSLPDMPDFEILSRSEGSSRSINLTFGKMESSIEKRVTLMIRPMKSGKLTIGPAVMSMAGNFKKKSRPITIEVVPVSGGAAPNTGSAGGDSAAATPVPAGAAQVNALGAPLTTFEKRTPNVFLRAMVSKDEAYIGEALTISYYLYTRKRLSDYNVLKKPSYINAWTENVNLGRRLPSKRLRIAGRVYEVYQLEKVVLFPKKAGTMQISAFECDVRVGGGFFDAGKRLVRTSQPFDITVRPLPEDGRPANFNPANVGNYQFSAVLDKGSTEVNQPVTLTMTINGEGNIKAIRPPQLASNKDFKVYPPNISDDMGVRNDNLVGQKQIEYLIVPLHEGQLLIPDISFAFFNPASGQYVVRPGPKFSIRVKPGKQGAVANGGIDAGPLPSADRLRGFRFEPDMEPATVPMVRRPMFTFLLYGPLLVLLLTWGGAGLALLIARLQHRQSASAERIIRSLQEQARTCAQKKEFSKALAAVSRSIEESTRLYRDTSIRGLTGDAVRVTLIENGTSEDIAEEVIHLLSDLESARFAPQDTMGAEMIHKVIDRAEALSQTLMKQA